MDTLYINIKKRREQLNLSQGELAELTGYTSRSSIAKIEAGVVDIPRSKIMAFAKALHCTPAELTGWDEETQYQLNNNDVLAKIIIKMRKDRKFFEAVKVLNDLNENKLDKATQILALL